MRVRISLKREIIVVSGRNVIIPLPVFRCLFFPVGFEVEETLPRGLKVVIPISCTETEVKIHVGLRVKN